MIELTTLFESACNLVLNAQLAPDPRMDGATDCYLVTLDDYNALVNALEETGRFKAPGA